MNVFSTTFVELTAAAAAVVADKTWDTLFLRAFADLEMEMLLLLQFLFKYQIFIPVKKMLKMVLCLVYLLTCPSAINAIEFEGPETSASLA